MVLLLSFRVPLLYMPPPWPLALLPEIVLFVTVSAPALFTESAPAWL
jgi:hypothetical protein